MSASDNSGSLILSEEEQFKDYQTKYDACDEQFQAQVSSIINGKAQDNQTLEDKQFRMVLMYLHSNKWTICSG